jgi:hypothetical protein
MDGFFAFSFIAGLAEWMDSSPSRSEQDSQNERILCFLIQTLVSGKPFAVGGR